MLYLIVEAIALAMNGLLYDLALRVIPGAPHAYALVRMGTRHIVFLCWSYPLWRWVFRVPLIVLSDAPADGVLPASQAPCRGTP